MSHNKPISVEQVAAVIAYVDSLDLEAKVKRVDRISQDQPAVPAFCVLVGCGRTTPQDRVKTQDGDDPRQTATAKEQPTHKPIAPAVPIRPESSATPPRGGQPTSSVPGIAIRPENVRQEPAAGSVVPDTSPRYNGVATVVSPDGYLVTGEHVIRGASKLAVKLTNRVYDAAVIAADRENDLALLLMFALPMITRRGPDPSVPGFRWKPSVHWLCKAQ